MYGVRPRATWAGCIRAIWSSVPRSNAWQWPRLVWALVHSGPVPDILQVFQRAKNCVCEKGECCQCDDDTALDFVLLGGTKDLFEWHASEMGLLMPIQVPLHLQIVFYAVV